MAKNKRNATAFGAVPRVDLLPSRQRAELVHERTMPKLLLAIVLSAVVAGLLALLGNLPVNLVNERLVEAENESTSLLEGLASHAETQNFKRNSEAIAAQIVPLTENEVHFSTLFDSVQAVLPEGAAILDFTARLASGDTIDTSLCSPGTVHLTFDVLTSSITTTAELLAALRGVDGYTCAEALQVTSGAEDTVNSMVQLVLDETVKVDRFAERGEQ